MYSKGYFCGISKGIGVHQILRTSFSRCTEIEALANG